MTAIAMLAGLLGALRHWATCEIRYRYHEQWAVHGCVARVGTASELHAIWAWEDYHTRMCSKYCVPSPSMGHVPDPPEPPNPYGR